MIPSEFMGVKSIKINFIYLSFKAASITFTNHTSGLQFLLTYFFIIIIGGRRCRAKGGSAFSTKFLERKARRESVEAWEM